jgi:pyruvate dehydrogenase E2 component (dihydrolipoamide acetyltransferase)
VSTSASGAVIDVIVPQVGEAIADVTLVRWLKQVGDPVSKGEPLFEVDTEKATFEVEAFADGTVMEILAGGGSSVRPLQVVARLASLAADASTVAGPAPPSRAEAAEPVTPAPLDVPWAGKPRGPLATPRARRLADDLGVDLTAVAGTGERGLVTADDVERAAGALQAVPSGSSPAADRSAIARRVQASKQNVPHFYLQVDVDMSAAERLRADARARTGQAPSITALIVKACALVLAADPSLNVRWDGEAATGRAELGIGVAVDTGRGLQIVTVGDAASLSPDETAARLRAVAERARRGRLRPEDAGAKSMVVSNLGMYGVDAFFAIIDEPDPMILSVGRIAERVVVDGKPEVRPVATLGLSIDHRALDGADGARFLDALRTLLESADSKLLAGGDEL